MSLLRFPYRVRMNPRRVQSAIIPLRIQGGQQNASRTREARVDSACDHSAVPISIARQLQIDLTNAETITLRTATGEPVTGYFARVSLATVDADSWVAEWDADVVFCDPDIPNCLVGYTGFGEFFAVHLLDQEFTVEPKAGAPVTVRRLRK